MVLDCGGVSDYRRALEGVVVIATFWDVLGIVGLFFYCSALDIRSQIWRA